MKKRTQYILAAGIIALSVASLVSQVDASWSRQKPRKKSVGKKEGSSFSISGIYTGEIGERVRHDGKTYWVTEDTMIYVVGSGFKERGIYVTDAHVLMYGDRKKGVPIIRTVLVRSREVPLSAHYTKPIVPAGTIPSEVNPKVGELSEDTPQ